MNGAPIVKRRNASTATVFAIVCTIALVALNAFAWLDDRSASERLASAQTIDQLRLSSESANRELNEQRGRLKLLTQSFDTPELIAAFTNTIESSSQECVFVCPSHKDMSSAWSTYMCAPDDTQTLVVQVDYAESVPKKFIHRDLGPSTVSKTLEFPLQAKKLHLYEAGVNRNVNGSSQFYLRFDGNEHFSKRWEGFVNNNSSYSGSDLQLGLSLPNTLHNEYGDWGKQISSGQWMAFRTSQFAFTTSVSKERHVVRVTAHLRGDGPIYIHPSNYAKAERFATLKLDEESLRYQVVEH